MPLLEDPVIFATLLLWTVGGCVAITTNVIKERELLGNDYTQFLLYELKDSPVLSIFGYLLNFTFSWVGLFFEDILEEVDKT